MKKVKSIRGFVIAVNKDATQWQVFTKDEYIMGEGFRNAEHDDCGSLQEALDNIAYDKVVDGEIIYGSSK